VFYFGAVFFLWGPLLKFKTCVGHKILVVL